MRSHINRYVSSKPIIEGGHLTTGHGLRLDDGNRDYSYLLFLSPAVTIILHKPLANALLHCCNRLPAATARRAAPPNRR